MGALYLCLQQPTYTCIIAFIVLHHNHLFQLTFLTWVLTSPWNLVLVLHCHETSKQEVKIRPKPAYCPPHSSMKHFCHIIPATVFLTGLVRMLLGGFEGCSSWLTLQSYPQPHLRKAHWPLPFGTGSSCTGCYSKDTETAGKNCCSRWSPQPNQTCSPSALCWGWKRCPE